MTTTLTKTPRLRFEVLLAPALGSTFQPTGFPDLGPAEFDAFDASGNPVRALLVESVQSMGNRLEATAWDTAAQQPAALLADLPYVRVHRASAPEQFLTSSRLEAHRLASAFVRDAALPDGRKMLQVITQRLALANDTPLNFPALAAALINLDPFALLHGVFFNQKEWFGQPRFTRAVSGVIEAYDVRRAVSGGRKSDQVRHALGEHAETGGGTSEGYGSVPFHRVEFTARQIKAMFSVDVQRLRSYNLGEQATELLITLALWEIRSLLDGGLRLRSACDLEPASPVTGTADGLPELADLETRLHDLLPAVVSGLEHTGPITVLWSPPKKNTKNTEAAAGSETEDTAA